MLRPARGHLGGLFFVLLAAAGCFTDSEPEPTRPSKAKPETSEAAAPNAEPLVIALRELPRQLDPLGDLGPWGDRIASDLLFEGLTARDPSGHPWGKPALADQCLVDREDAPRHVWCHLPAGAKFHDGTEVSAADVEYSLQWWLDQRRAWMRQRHGLASVKSVSVLDQPRNGRGYRDEGRWIEVGFSEANPLALEVIAEMKVVPAAKHRGRPARFGRQPIGTGPMRLTEIEADRIVLERVKAGEGAERLVFLPVNDGAEALSLLRRGEVHVLPRVAPVHVPVELGKPGMAVRFDAWLRSPPTYDLLLYRQGRGKEGPARLAGPRMRAAFHVAVPRSALEREVFRAPGLPVEAPVDLHEPVRIDLQALVDARSTDRERGGLVGYRDADADAAGAAHAASELDALGWTIDRGLRRRSELTLRVVLMWDGAAGRARAASDHVREAWGALGVVIPEARAAWSYLVTLIRQGHFDVALLRLGGRTDDDLYDLFHSKGGTPLAGTDDQALDDALEAYRSARDRAGRDAAKRAVALRLDELDAVTILHAPTEVMVVSKRVDGLVFVDDLPRLDVLELRPERRGSAQ